MRSLADEVGIDEDRQAQSAGADVADREGHLAGQSLFDAEVRFVRQWRNEVGIEAVEALRAESAGPLTAGAVPPVGKSAEESGGPVTGNGTLGYLRLLAALGTVGQRALETVPTEDSQPE